MCQVVGNMLVIKEGSLWKNRESLEKPGIFGKMHVVNKEIFGKTHVVNGGIFGKQYV